MNQESKSISDMAGEILEKTNDGDDLSPPHLKMVENAVNGFLSELGEVKFYELHKMVMEGYTKPFYHDVENMTQDHEGYIYYKNIRVEHYSFRDYDEADKAIKKLEKDCKELEARKIKVSWNNLSDLWSEQWNKELMKKIEEYAYEAKQRFGNMPNVHYEVLEKEFNKCKTSIEQACKDLEKIGKIKFVDAEIIQHTSERLKP